MQNAPPRSFQPTTFLERGASVAFTTPLLTGTRVRPAQRFGLELIVPNPSGGRGHYILPWTDLGALCRPTVHDIQLTERIAALPSVTPATIRRAAREIASQGFAGRAAGKAAGLALAAERESLVATNISLLLRLVQQEEPPGATSLPPEAERAADLERRAKRTIAHVAPRLGQNADTIGASLEQLAALYEPIGLGLRSAPARLPGAVGLLKLLRQEAAAMAPDAEEHVCMLLELLIQTADLTLGLAEQALTDTKAMANNVMSLLSAWKAGPVALGRNLVRADWLMDGWERILKLWGLEPNPVARRDILEEVVALLPIIPHEAGDCVGFHVEMQAKVQLCRFVPGHHDWRTGLCVQDSVARNEAMLAA